MHEFRSCSSLTALRSEEVSVQTNQQEEQLRKIYFKKLKINTFGEDFEGKNVIYSKCTHCFVLSTVHQFSIIVFFSNNLFCFFFWASLVL